MSSNLTATAFIGIPGGLLVVFEGIDGAGKSTQIERLAAVARNRGHECVASREPTYGPHGRQLRESARSGRLAVEDEHRLLLLDRREHVDELIAPALVRGAVVVLDRYYFSSVAYQSGGSLPAEQILADNRAFAPTPDLVLLLDLPVDVGLARIGARDAKPDAFESRATLTRCREVFLSFATLPYARLVDATQSVDAMAAEVAAAFARAVDRKFEIGR